MTKDELKKEATECWKRWYDEGGNEDISELLYMFAEPRTKRITELEGICKDLSDKFDYQVKQVMKLEKENELLNIDLYHANGNLDIAIDQLAQAKEILKMIVNYYPCYNKTITEQAEQFLEEIEK